MLKRIIAITVFTAAALASLAFLPHDKDAVEQAEIIVRHRISDFDDIMRAVGGESGIDWRLLSAIAHTESQFRADAVSEAGAVGLMQVMPSTGNHFGIADEALGDPRTNVWVAAMYLCELSSKIDIPQELPLRDRWGIILACYNAGLGHVIDARRLAALHGENRNSWIAVSHWLRQKNDPQYYEHEVVACGSYKGGRRTTAYVRDVLKCYERYCRLTEAKIVED